LEEDVTCLTEGCLVIIMYLCIKRCCQLVPTAVQRIIVVKVGSNLKLT